MAELGDVGKYAVVAVRSASAPPGDDAPPEIRTRFEGRTFTPRALEERGVRIVGGRAVYTANGQDWLLSLAPPVVS